MSNDNLKLSDLKIGQQATILSFIDAELSLKLLEMGCLPGEVVKVTSIAPFGDPIAIEVSGYSLAIGKTEASTINVLLHNNK
jgi:ferrous iron transport protein A